MHLPTVARLLADPPDVAAAASLIESKPPHARPETGGQHFLLAGHLYGTESAVQSLPDHLVYRYYLVSTT